MINNIPAVVDIAIIGGGASGVLTAVQLIRGRQAQIPARPLSIVMVDSSERVARGAAYSTRSPEHLLNVPAKGMSGIADDKDHFYNWLQRNGLPVTRESFAPRMVYGDYLEYLLLTTQASAPRHIDLQIVRDKAIKAEKRSSSVKIEFASGDSVQAKVVILALGNFEPEQSVFSSFVKDASANYHQNPWSAATFEAIGRDEDVFVIGTGLTMIDVTLQLRAGGHRGNVIAASRHGYLPQVHFADERLADDRPTNYLPETLPSKTAAAFHIVRRAIKSAEIARPGNWRYVMNELRTKTAATWKGMNAIERRRFLRHVRQLWETHRHRMAPEIHNKLEELIDDQIVTVVAGRIAHIQPSQTGYYIAVDHRSGDTEIVHCDHIVNCTGPQTDLRRVNDPLISALVKAGTLCPDELGLSANVDDKGALISSLGYSSSSFFAVGALRKGNLWESTAVPEIREQAAELARTVLFTLDKQNASASGYRFAPVPFGALTSR